MKKSKSVCCALFQVVILFILSIGLCACPDEADNADNAINFYNNSSSDVYIFFGYPTGEKGEAIFPDTMITSQRRLTTLIKKNGGYAYYEYRHFKDQPSVYHLYIFDADTVKKYSWDEIRAGYKVLKRYDLNIENGLKEFNSVITYPPSENMKDVPMYPPYQ